MDLTIRQARSEDAETIAAFNRAMAIETEGMVLDGEISVGGVRAMLERPQLARLFGLEALGLVEHLTVAIAEDVGAEPTTYPQ